jgi:cell division septation protein DedD
VRQRRTTVGLAMDAAGIVNFLSLDSQKSVPRRPDRVRPAAVRAGLPITARGGVAKSVLKKRERQRKPSDRASSEHLLFPSRCRPPRTAHTYTTGQKTKHSTISQGTATASAHGHVKSTPSPLATTIQNSALVTPAASRPTEAFASLQ